jgi:hypothetical protein
MNYIKLQPNTLNPIALVPNVFGSMYQIVIVSDVIRTLNPIALVSNVFGSINPGIIGTINPIAFVSWNFLASTLRSTTRKKPILRKYYISLIWLGFSCPPNTQRQCITTPSPIVISQQLGWKKQG